MECFNLPIERNFVKAINKPTWCNCTNLYVELFGRATIVFLDQNRWAPIEKLRTLILPTEEKSWPPAGHGYKFVSKSFHSPWPTVSYVTNRWSDLHISQGLW